MMNVVLIFILFSAAAQAGWWKPFCERHLIAPDPYPYADEPFTDLLEFYSRTHKGQILDEILYRLRAGILTDAEKRLFWEHFRP